MLGEFNKNDFSSILAVSNRHLYQLPFSRQIEAICRLHPAALILREKDLSDEEYDRLAREIMPLCADYQVPCILHSSIQTAASLQAPALHLPLHILKKARKEHLIPDTVTWLGTSVHSVEEAKEAAFLGADYLIAGHIYATDCKKGVPPRGTGFLKEVCRSVTLPIYGIGGIKNRIQLQELLACGAKGGCIMSGWTQTSSNI